MAFFFCLFQNPRLAGHWPCAWVAAAKETHFAHLSSLLLPQSPFFEVSFYLVPVGGWLGLGKSLGGSEWGQLDAHRHPAFGQVFFWLMWSSNVVAANRMRMNGWLSLSVSLMYLADDSNQVRRDWLSHAAQLSAADDHQPTSSAKELPTRTKKERRRHERHHELISSAGRTKSASHPSE